jgi:neutral amino acid transport system permease protein
MPVPAWLGRSLAALFAALVVLLLVPGVAGAQDAEEPTGAEAIQGTLTYENADGEKVPVEGVAIAVTDASGAAVGDGATGPDGTFTIGLPGPGSYNATLDTGTLPEGINLRNADRASLAFDVAPDQVRSVLFPLVEGESTGAVGKADDSQVERAIRLFVEGLRFGLILAVSSVGLSLIYGTTGLVNFAHGEMVTLGAVITYMINVTWGIHLLLAAPLGIIVAAALAGGSDRGFWRPLRKRGTGLTALMIISIGVSLVLQYLILYQFGDRSRTYGQYRVQTDGVEIGPVSLAPKDIATMVICAVVLGLVVTVLLKTRVGKAMRAVSDNKDLASSSGINVDGVITWVWVAAGGLAALGGVLLGLGQTLVNWQMGQQQLLLMFAAVTLGGLGSAFGPIAGSIVLGVVIEMSTLFIAPELKTVGALVVMIVILMFRPQGIFGRAERFG